MWRRRVTLRFYLVMLSGVYFTMVYIFHGRLQLEMTHDDADGDVINKFFTTKTKELSYMLKDSLQQGRDIKRRVLETNVEEMRLSDNISRKVNASNLVTINNKRQLSTKSSSVDRELIPSCFAPSNIPNRTFQALDPTTFVYSAYLDERYTKKIIRIMAMFNLDKRNRKLNFYCTFQGKGSDFRVKASVYELCENHGKPYGGYILSCDVPSGATTVCNVSVAMETMPVHSQYKPPRSQPVTVSVTRLGHKLPASQTSSAKSLMSVPYNFTICIPPLFGKIDRLHFIEYIELNRILGVQHFIFYIAHLDNPSTIDVLNHYKQLGLVTVIFWNMPFVTQKDKIWYNGQLNAHNDCLYRSMTMTRYLAVIDIDEFIVPHNGDMTLHSGIQNLLDDDTTCGLSFKSAFYDPKFATGGANSKLVTMSRTARSSIFSSIRTKVLVRPERIFEVGIHHISKPAQEWYKVNKVNTSTAFLHHYRSCVPNYGMKCSKFDEDTTLHKYREALSAGVASVMKKIFSIEETLH